MTGYSEISSQLPVCRPASQNFPQARLWKWGKGAWAITVGLNYVPEKVIENLNLEWAIELTQLFGQVPGLLPGPFSRDLLIKTVWQNVRATSPQAGASIYFNFFFEHFPTGPIGFTFSGGLHSETLIKISLSVAEQVLPPEDEEVPFQ